MGSRNIINYIYTIIIIHYNSIYVLTYRPRSGIIILESVMSDKGVTLQSEEESIAQSIVPSKEDIKFWSQFGPLRLSSYARRTIKNPNWQKESRRKLKIEVLTHYGGGKLACVRCGFSDIRALSIDHINGCGEKYRAGSSHVLLRRLRREGYPEGYQTLCMNCQFIKAEENGERHYNWGETNGKRCGNND